MIKPKELTKNEKLFLDILQNVDAVEIFITEDYKFITTPLNPDFGKDVYINLTDLKNFLYDYNEKIELKNLGDVKLEFRHICNKLGFNYYDISSKSRKKELVIKRHFVRWWLAVKCEYSLQSIGRQTKSDHSTVIHSREKIEDILNMPTDEFHKQINRYIYVLELEEDGNNE
jgi:hypothetical protein